MQAERTNSEPRQAQLEAESAQLRAEKARLRALQEELTKQLQSLREQVQGLQRRLGLDSSNSGKPPSSDGPAKPPAAQRTRSQRGRCGKSAGGQRGHKGATLSQTDTPDRIQAQLPSSCADCGAEVSADAIEGEPQRRQVYDLAPPPPLEVSEQQAHACRCAVCGRVPRAAFPEGVNAAVQ